MRRVILESPYAGDVETNLAYARRCVLDCLARDEAPIASHLLFTQMLDDTVPAQRELGMRAGLAWMVKGVCEAVVVYVDRGISNGMRQAMNRAHELGLAIEIRTLPK